MNGQLHAQATLLPGNSPWYQLSWGWVGTRAGLKTWKKRKISCCYWKLNYDSLVV